MTKNPAGNPDTPVPTVAAHDITVVRSAVPIGLNYTEYKPYLQEDFLFSCAYCTMSESEATSVRFTIDHYEPRSSRPDLEHLYENLMYACDECNKRKGPRSPSTSAREKNVRFFRPDQDARSDHFEAVDFRLNPASEIGAFSIDAIDLNRDSLQRLRRIRRDATDCLRFVSEGVAGLRKFHIDQLPQHIRAQALKAIKQVIYDAEQAGEAIDAILRAHARSPLEDPSNGTFPQSEADNQDRLIRLKKTEALYPGDWNMSRPKRS